MRKRLLLYISIIIAIFLFGIYIYDKIIRCNNNGLSRENAIKISNIKVENDFRDQLSFKELILEKEYFDDSDKSWIFTYRIKDCIIDCVVDKCGVCDIGGITEGCIPKNISEQTE